MKKMKIFSTIAVFGALLASTAACGGGSKKITVWVGDESLAFYQKVCQEFLALEENKDFGFEIEVKAQDTGAAAGVITQDASAAADIYTVAHDNVGKLVATKNAKPITDAELIAQVEADNSADFVSVNKVGDQLYGVPYISQALFLMYNKSKVSEEQAQSFEGLRAAAAAAGSDVKGWTVTGADGFNFSYTLLARKDSDKTSSLKLYEGGTKDTGSCWVQGDDEVAFVKWAQKMRKDPNGMMWASSDGWNMDLANNATLAVIGGAWHYEAFVQSVGSENAGLALIPTFTLDADTAFGTATAGTTYRGGTFADCKVFMINGKSKSNKYPAEQKLLKYLSSTAIQDRSFVECNNVPAYKAFSAEAVKQQYPEVSEQSIKLASVQTGMAAYGMPQPFVTGTLNTFFYSKGAPDLYKVIVDQYDTSLKKEVYTTDADIQKGLYTMQYIWQKGKKPADGEIPATLPADI